METDHTPKRSYHSSDAARIFRLPSPLFVGLVVIGVMIVSCEADGGTSVPSEFQVTVVNSDESMRALLSELERFLPNFPCRDTTLGPETEALVDRSFKCVDPHSLAGFECYLYFKRVNWAFCDQKVPFGQTLNDIKGVCFVDNIGDATAAGSNPWLFLRINCKGTRTNAVCSITRPNVGRSVGISDKSLVVECDRFPLR